MKVPSHFDVEEAMARILDSFDLIPEEPSSPQRLRRIPEHLLEAPSCIGVPLHHTPWGTTLVPDGRGHGDPAVAAKIREVLGTPAPASSATDISMQLDDSWFGRTLPSELEDALGDTLPPTAREERSPTSAGGTGRWLERAAFFFVGLTVGLGAGLMGLAAIVLL